MQVAPIILRRYENDGIPLRNLAAPGTGVFERIDASRGHLRLIVHRQRPVFQIHDFERSGHGLAANLRHPFGNRRANAPQTRAADDDENSRSVYHARNIGLARSGVKVQNTRNFEKLGASLVDLIGFLNSPQRDDALLREAGVSLDRALFPLLVALGARGPLNVAELADQVGRDHTTVSRQLAKLETLNLIERGGSDSDRRRRTAWLTGTGKRIVQAITLARRRLLARALADWSEADRAALANLNRRFADALVNFANDRT